MKKILTTMVFGGLLLSGAATAGQSDGAICKDFRVSYTQFKQYEFYCVDVETGRRIRTRPWYHKGLKEVCCMHSVPTSPN